MLSSSAIFASCSLVQLEPLPTIAPKHVLDFSDLGDLFSSSLSPDGSSLYVLIHARYIDLGAAIAFYWPEWLGIFSALACLILLILIIRRSRRQQDDAHTHCRRCNYILPTTTEPTPSPAPAANCPECGVDLTKRRPVRGRAAWRRIRLPLALALLIAGGYFSMRLANIPRGVRWLHPDWRSAAAVEWSDRPRLAWLKKFRDVGDLVLEVDAATGKRSREVCRRPACTLFQLCLTPDGSGFYLERKTHDGIDLISTTSGRTTASFVTPYSTGPHCFRYDLLGNVIIGHSADGRSAILSYWDDSTTTAYAVRWTPSSGKIKEIASSPAFVDKSSGTPVCEGRQFLLQGRTEPSLVISVPLFMEAYSHGGFDIRWFDAGGEEWRHNVVGPDVAVTMPVIHPAGKLGYFQSRRGDSLIPMDLDGVHPGIPKPLPDDEQILGRIALSTDGARLLVPGTDHLMILSLPDWNWVQRLKCPPNFYAPRAISAPTSTRIAAVFQGRSKAHGTALFAAVIWDVPPDISVPTKRETP